MVPVEWPLAAPAADRPVEPARTRGSRRLASVRRDFFLDPAHRLTEQERALMTAMLNDLVGSVASELLAALPGESSQRHARRPGLRCRRPACSIARS